MDNNTTNNPLLYNIIRGFADIAINTYKDTPHTIIIGKYTIRILLKYNYSNYITNTDINNNTGNLNNTDNTNNTDNNNTDNNSIDNNSIDNTSIDNDDTGIIDTYLLFHITESDTIVDLEYVYSQVILINNIGENTVIKYIKD